MGLADSFMVRGRRLNLPLRGVDPRMERELSVADRQDRDQENIEREIREAAN